MQKNSPKEVYREPDEITPIVEVTRLGQSVKMLQINAKSNWLIYSFCRSIS